MTYQFHSFKRMVATLLIYATLGLMSAGCSSPPQGQNLPPVDDTQRGNTMSQQTTHTGMSTGTKVVLLAGAAAMYYLYKKHQASQGTGENGQYYLSKNGRVYYRDAQHRAHWVTPPPGGLQVPAAEAQQYQGYQGYNNQNTGKTLENMGSDAP